MRTRLITPRRASLPRFVSTVTTGLAALVAFFSPVCLMIYADAADDKLAAAKEAYENGVAEAKAEVIATYRAEIVRLSEKKLIEDATRTTDEMKLFEKDGIILARKEIMKAFMKYGAAKKKLGDALTEAYVDAATAQTKAGNTAEGEKLLRDLAALRLPGKLNSIKLFGTSGYVQHADYLGIVKPAPNASLQMNATFEVVNGLSESGYVSLRSLNIPNYYFSHGDFRLRMAAFQDNDGFRQNSTFKRVKGLAAPGGVSFESVNFPDHYIRVRRGELWLDKSTAKGFTPASATFAIAEPLVKLW